MTPFEMLAQDMEEVIMLINYYIEKDEDNPPKPKKSGKPERIKVNDNTATGGWF